MMEEKKTIFDYLSQVLSCFGFSMLCMIVIIHFFGDSVQDYSSFFLMGARGIPVETGLQLFIMSLLIILYKSIIFSGFIFKEMGFLLRAALLVVMSLVTLAVFALLFGWFPINDWKPWIYCFTSFIVCFIVSVLLTLLKRKVENKRLAEGLSKIKADLENK